ncbi:MAG: hypothetical protein IPK85_26885 [Gemmatimonadetes bacterium]|nr:hypothetical protein [Gemmatimonadota bacterium]
MRPHLLLLTSLVACRSAVTAEVTPPPPLPPAIARLALVHDVSLVGAPAPSLAFHSLLGQDALAVEVRDLRRSMVGAVRPGWVRVTASVRIHNRLTRTRLVTPTFPTAPDGGGGIYLFAARVEALATPGGITVTSPNELRIAVPGSGTVSPSVDWDGLPFDYWRSTPCLPPGPTCARFKRFAAPVAAGDATEWRTIGFDAEPTVRDVRLHLVLAADLANPD